MIKYEHEIKEWVEFHIGTDFEFREHQLETISDIIDSVLTDATKVKIIEAPTGSGKSLLSIISAGVLDQYFSKTSYILCSDLFLFSQYESFIKSHSGINFGMLKGQTGNYLCAMNNEDVRNGECRIAKVSWSKLFSSSSAKEYGFSCADTCQYIAERKKAVRSHVTLMTYQLYFYMINVVKNSVEEKAAPFKQRDVIFCDECHNIPSIIQGQCTPVVKVSDFDNFREIYNYNMRLHTGLFSDEADCPDLKKTWPDLHVFYEAFRKYWKQMIDEKNESGNQIFDFIKDIIEPLQPTVDVLEEALAQKRTGPGTLTKKDYEMYKVCSWYRNYHCFISDFSTAIKDCGDQYLVKQIHTPIDEADDEEASVSFSCVKEDYMCYRYLLSTPLSQSVLMSATVGGKEAYDENIGMSYFENPSIMSRIPSTFDFSHSPVYIKHNSYYMSYDKIDRNLPKIAEQINGICKSFSNFRGMIQTGSYKVAYDIVMRMPVELKQRVFIYKDSKQKNKILYDFKNSTNGILIGPTLNEGIDLPDDLCRFIIIAKVPYPSLADKLVKRKMELFKNWYASTTSNQIIQGIGRGNRNKTDWCVTYILDGCFHKLYEKTKDQYSPELQSRIKII